ncbi:MAG: DUF1007 family protein [Gammaproteobacteria bacterium]
MRKHPLAETLLKRCAVWLAGLSLGISAFAASAHPHVIIEAYPDLVIDAEQRVTALNMRWVFDELYSTFAVQGLDTDGNGELDADELNPLARQIVDKLPQYDHFLRFTLTDKALAFVTITDYRITFQEGQLKLSFTLPLQQPAELSGGTLRFATFDPSFYIGILLGDEIEPLSISGTLPPACRLSSAPGKSVAEAGVMPESFFKAGNDTSEFAAQFAQWVTIDCRPSTR